MGSVERIHDLGRSVRTADELDPVNELRKSRWDPAKHPRGPDGRFVPVFTDWMGAEFQLSHPVTVRPKEPPGEKEHRYGGYRGLQRGRHVIDVAPWLPDVGAVSVLAHEMAHARQRERHGSGFHEMARIEREKVGYKDSKYEREARLAATKFMSRFESKFVKRKWDPKLHPRDPLGRFIEKHPFGFHRTSATGVASIEREGITPEHRDTGMEGSAPGHVYVFTDPRGKGVEDAEFRVDLRKLDREKFAFDADWADVLMTEDELGGGRYTAYTVQERVTDNPDYQTPEMLEYSAKIGSLAYRGTIPPEAVERNPAFWGNRKRVADHERRLEEAKERRREYARIEADFERHQAEIPSKIVGSAGHREGPRITPYFWSAEGDVWVNDDGIYVKTEPPKDVVEAMTEAGVETRGIRELRERWEQHFGKQ